MATQIETYVDRLRNQKQDVIKALDRSLPLWLTGDWDVFTELYDGKIEAECMIGFEGWHSTITDWEATCRVCIDVHTYVADEDKESAFKGWHFTPQMSVNVRVEYKMVGWVKAEIIPVMSRHYDDLNPVLHVALRQLLNDRLGAENVKLTIRDGSQGS